MAGGLLGGKPWQSFNSQPSMAPTSKSNKSSCAIISATELGRAGNSVARCVLMVSVLQAAGGAVV